MCQRTGLIPFLLSCPAFAAVSVASSRHPAPASIFYLKQGRGPASNGFPGNRRLPHQQRGHGEPMTNAADPMAKSYVHQLPQAACNSAWFDIDEPMQNLSHRPALAHKTSGAAESGIDSVQPVEKDKRGFPMWFATRSCVYVMKDSSVSK